MQQIRYAVSTRTKPGVKYRPTVTQNGHTEGRNPLVALIPLCSPWQRGGERG